MSQSKVFFTDFHATPSETLPQKLHRLMKRAGFEEIQFEDRYTAIKIHFGELGNLAHLRPQYAKVVADYVRERGGKVFLTDCNTLYVGSRKNALDHMDTAYLNGFSPLQTGCHVIIADGLKGTDEALVPVNLPLVKEAKIGQAIMDADIVISLTHFKGHEEAGFGGALKNLGMGSGSRSGKMEQHWEGKPVVEPVDKYTLQIDVAVDGEAKEAYQENDLQTAMRVKPWSAALSYLCEILKARHIGRLSRGECNLTQGTAYTELLNSFERIGSHCVAVSGAVRRESQASPDIHVHSLKANELSEQRYQQIYDEFLAKYDVLNSAERPLSVEDEAVQ